jgi:hypothetical protein
MPEEEQVVACAPVGGQATSCEGAARRITKGEHERTQSVPDRPSRQ